MMLMGALGAFAATHSYNSLLAGVLAGMLAGGIFAMIHGFFSITLRVNQVVSGLALTLFGIGLSNFLGRSLIGKVSLKFEPSGSHHPVGGCQEESRRSGGLGNPL